MLSEPAPEYATRSAPPSSTSLRPNKTNST